MKIREYLDSLSAAGDTETIFRIGDFTALIALEEEHNLESEITEYTVENGATVSDYIIHKPEKFKVKGVTSATIAKQTQLEAAIQKINKDYGRIAEFLPTRTTRQLASLTQGVTIFRNKIQDGIRKIEDILQISSVGDYKQDFAIRINQAYFNREKLEIYINSQKFDNIYLKNSTLKTNTELDRVEFEFEFQRLGFADEPTAQVAIQGTEKKTKKGLLNTAKVPAETANQLTKAFTFR